MFQFGAQFLRFAPRFFFDFLTFALRLFFRLALGLLARFALFFEFGAQLFRFAPRFFLGFLTRAILGLAFGPCFRLGSRPGLGFRPSFRFRLGFDTRGRFRPRFGLSLGFGFGLGFGIRLRARRCCGRGFGFLQRLGLRFLPRGFFSLLGDGRYGWNHYREIEIHLAFRRIFLRRGGRRRARGSRGGWCRLRELADEIAPGEDAQGFLQLGLRQLADAGLHLAHGGLAVDLFEDRAHVTRQGAGFPGRLHQAFGGLRKDCFAIHAASVAER